jgi:hypothetical protein
MPDERWTDIGNSEELKTKPLQEIVCRPGKSSAEAERILRIASPICGAQERGLTISAMSCSM